MWGEGVERPPPPARLNVYRLRKKEEYFLWK